MCGESDLKTCIAMLIMDRLDIGGSFAEFHPIDFREGFVLVGHDGPHHINIAEGKPVLRSLLKYHGKPGSGASVEFKIKEGPITMLSIGVTYEGKFKFVIAEGRERPRPDPADGQHQHARLLPARRAHVPQTLGGRRPHAPLRPGRGQSRGHLAADRRRAGHRVRRRRPQCRNTDRTQARHYLTKPEEHVMAASIRSRTFADARFAGDCRSPAVSRTAGPSSSRSCWSCC